MPHDILDSMRALREDMRQRLMQVPEYRALMALDRSIDEICDILQDSIAQMAHPAVAPPPIVGQPDVAQQNAQQYPEAEAVVAVERVVAPAPAPLHPARQGAIASAFAETLAAKLDQRNGARAGASYLPPTHNVRGG